MYFVHLSYSQWTTAQIRPGAKIFRVTHFSPRGFAVNPRETESRQIALDLELKIVGMAARHSRSILLQGITAARNNRKWISPR